MSEEGNILRSGPEEWARRVVITEEDFFLGKDSSRRESSLVETKSKAQEKSGVGSDFREGKNV